MFRTFLCQQPEIQVYQLLLFLFPVSNIIAIYFESIPLSNFFFFSFSSKTILSSSLFKEHSFKCKLLFIYLYLLLLPF